MKIRAVLEFEVLKMPIGVRVPTPDEVAEMLPEMVRSLSQDGITVICTEAVVVDRTPPLLVSAEELE